MSDSYLSTIIGINLSLDGDRERDDIKWAPRASTEIDVEYLSPRIHPSDDVVSRGSDVAGTGAGVKHDRRHVDGAD